MSGSPVTIAGKFFRRGDHPWTLRGVSYGPFKEPAKNESLRADLDLIVRLGFNTLRTYEFPTEEMLRSCVERDLQLLVTLPWPSHTDFLRDEASLDQVRYELIERVRGMRGKEGIIGYLVANEIPASLVRWMRPKRVFRFLEGLIDDLRGFDPDRLYSYANYPSTEYLQPRNVDFVGFNVYLEQRENYRRYLRRLQHVAGDLPLVVTEFGVDSIRAGQFQQREILSWQAEENEQLGVAGNVIYSFTDEWFNAGQEVTDWAFGLTTRERHCKAAATLFPLQSRRSVNQQTPGNRALESMTSVVVCCHNGHKLLPACLNALTKSLHPNLEVIVVDDGSEPSLESAVRAVSGVRYERIPHSGLSAARNHGASVAKGAIILFTDDDCEVHPEWVSRMVEAMDRDGLDVAGGPNIAPEKRGIAGCIPFAQGNPTHVMLNDIEAEHLPGCNLAVRRSAFDAVNGFQAIYRVAGDDVDFCWRLRDAGFRLGFVPGAIVWHHPRSNIRGFFRQQYGYGKAEALLMEQHPQRFSPTGGTQWQGRVYEPACPFAMGWRGQVVYFGTAGTAPYQFLYSPLRGAPYQLSSLAGGFSWHLTALVLCVAGWVWMPLLWLGSLMFCTSGFAAAWRSSRRFLPFRLRTVLGRLGFVVLHWGQPLMRNAAFALNRSPVMNVLSLGSLHRHYWTRRPHSHEQLLELLRPEKELEWGSPWTGWDARHLESAGRELYLRTATENHDNGDVLIRTGVSCRLNGLHRMILMGGWLIVLLIALKGWWMAFAMMTCVSGFWMTWLGWTSREKLRGFQQRIDAAASKLNWKQNE